MSRRPMPIKRTPPQPPNVFAAGAAAGCEVQPDLNTEPAAPVPARPSGIYTFDGQVHFTPLDIERLARMASVDGSWWQDCDRQTLRDCEAQMLRRARVWSRWLYGLLGAGLGLALGAAGVAYQTLG
jgi:hypothetical protein